MGRIKSYISILIIISMQFYTFNSAYASSFANWNFSGAVSKGATTTWKAATTVAGAAYTTLASVKPTAPQLSKFISRAGLAGALIIPVQSLLDGVDYVLDPENNTIKFKTKPTHGYYTDFQNKIYNTADDLCRAALETTFKGLDFSRCVFDGPVQDAQGIKVFVSYQGREVNSTLVGYYLDRPNPNSNKEKTIPLDEVSQQIIDKAEENEPKAVAYVGDAASTVFDEKDYNRAVPASDIVIGTGTATDPYRKYDDGVVTGSGTLNDPYTNSKDKPKPTTPTTTLPETPATTIPETPATTIPQTPSTTIPETETKIDIPTDCKLFQTACNFYDWTKDSYSQVETNIKEYVKTLTDYFNPEQSKSDEMVDVDKENQSNEKVDTTIKFSSNCPAKITLLNTNFLGIEINWFFDFTDFCGILSNYVKPIVILSGSFSALLIMGGRKDG